jgi:hypothetical protein
MDYTTPKRFKVKHVTLPASSSVAEKSGDHAVTPSTVGPSEFSPDSVVTAANPVTSSSAESALSGVSSSTNEGQSVQQATEGVKSSIAASVAVEGRAVSAAERVKMNSRSCNNKQQQQLQQGGGLSVGGNNNSNVSAAITPSIELGPRVSHGDNRVGGGGTEADDEEMASPPPVMKLNMRRGESAEIEKQPAQQKKETTHPIVAAPGAPKTPAVSQQKQQSQSFKAEHHNLPPPAFLAAKISPLRSKSSKAKKAEANKVRGKTPPPPSAAMAAASTKNASNELLSPGMFLAPRTPKGSTQGSHTGTKASGAMTPSNFASDFGKGFKQEHQYDPANSFAWLDTPGGQGLFSPNGGLTTYSVHNTPRGMYGFLGAGKTPGGNALSDAEVLKANGDLGVNTPKVPDAQQSMICISPLRKGKNKSSGAPETPINYSEIFASPQSTIRKADIHTAENNINLDADLNELLQLAGKATPGGTRPVSFLSPVLSTHLRRASTNGDSHEPPSSLQLPIISGTSAPSAEKSTPQLSIRSTSGGRSASKNPTGRKRGRPPKKKPVETPAPKQQKRQKQQQYQEQNYPQPQVLHYHGGAPQQYYHPPHQQQGGWVYPGQPPQYTYHDHKKAPSLDESGGKTPSKGRGTRRGGRAPPSTESTPAKRRRTPTPKKAKVQQELDPKDNEKINEAINAVRRSGGGKQKKSDDKGSLPRGVTMRPSGKWQAQLYYAGKSRYIGVFDSREKACLAYEISREVLKTDKGEEPKSSEIDANINLARKAAFAGVGKN